MELLFARVDLNKSGFVSYTEFIASQMDMKEVLSE
jgi:hypothetical protein